VSERDKPYEGNRSHTPAAAGAGPVCEHGPECSVRELWPLDGETHDQFVARLTAKYSGSVPQRGGYLW